MKWRREKSLEETYLKRPELLEKRELDDVDKSILSAIKARYEDLEEFLKK